MKNYTAHDVQNWLADADIQLTHGIVAHTHFRTYNRDRSWLATKRAETSQALTIALHMFTKSLWTGKDRVRMRDRQNWHIYRPSTLVTIEGANQENFGNSSLTIHANITMGNLPQDFSGDELGQKFAACWHKLADFKNTDVKGYQLDRALGEARWIGYTIKEGQKHLATLHSTNGCWDVDNTFWCSAQTH